MTCHLLNHPLLPKEQRWASPSKEMIKFTWKLGKKLQDYSRPRAQSHPEINSCQPTRRGAEWINTVNNTEQWFGAKQAIPGQRGLRFRGLHWHRVALSMTVCSRCSMTCGSLGGLIRTLRRSCHLSDVSQKHRVERVADIQIGQQCPLSPCFSSFSFNQGFSK